MVQCCYLEDNDLEKQCPASAEWEIENRDDPPFCTTLACTTHVGQLLGAVTPAGLTHVYTVWELPQAQEVPV